MSPPPFFFRSQKKKGRRRRRRREKKSIISPRAGREERVWGKTRSGLRGGKGIRIRTSPTSPIKLQDVQQRTSTTSTSTTTTIIGAPPGPSLSAHRHLAERDQATRPRRLLSRHCPIRGRERASERERKRESEREREWEREQ